MGGGRSGHRYSPLRAGGGDGDGVLVWLRVSEDSDWTGTGQDKGNEQWGSKGGGAIERGEGRGSCTA